MADTRTVKGFIVSGTDTGIGKTVFAAALAGALGASYWKPLQAGTEHETDTESVAKLAGLPQDRLLTEAYRLKRPASPHLAAAAEGILIDPARLMLPACERPLVVEGAGGLLVPVRDDLLQIDVFKGWGLPVVLCASTRLGTINHTLLSIEALRARGMPLHGVAFIGYAEPEVEATIVRFGQTKRLGRLPMIEPLNAEGLADAFGVGFDVADFEGVSGAGHVG